MTAAWNYTAKNHRTCIVALVVCAAPSFWKATTTLDGNAKQFSTTTTSLSDFSPIIPIRIFRPNPRLEIAFDARTRTPVYVLERLEENSKRIISKEGDDDSTSSERRRRRYRFHEEKRLPEMFRSRNSHYHLSGYDRGHLAPAANFSESDDWRHDSYNLINVAPQKADMNRKIWLSLERWTRRIAADNEDTYTVTGPLWLPARRVDEKQFEYQYPALGRPPSLLSVPTHFFKVVITVKSNGSHESQIEKFACFVVPNEDSQEGKQLLDYLVRLSDLEAVSGLCFFPALMTEKWKELADSETERVIRSHRRAQSPTMLLTDGSEAKPKESGSWIALRKRSPPGMHHLCKEGQCLYPPSITKQ